MLAMRRVLLLLRGPHILSLETDSLDESDGVEIFKVAARWLTESEANINQQSVKNDQKELAT